jgi:hypothetical protein
MLPVINGTDRIEYPGISRNVKYIHRISTDKKHTRSRERGASLLASVLASVLITLLASLLPLYLLLYSFSLPFYLYR